MKKVYPSFRSQPGIESTYPMSIADFVPDTAVAAVVRDGTSILADPAFIQILYDSEEWDLGGVNEACQLPNQRSNESLGARAEGSRSATVVSTPEKTAEQVEDGSGSKNYTSSSSGEPVPNKFERRIIKPSPCIRSPFTGYNEKKCFTANLMSIGYIHRLSYMGY